MTMTRSTQETNRPRVPRWRGRRLIKPRLQLGLIGKFAALLALGLVLQALFLCHEIAELRFREAGKLPAELVPLIAGRTAIYAFVCTLPVTLAVGVVATFRWAGPIYRFEQHLAAIARGEPTGPCHIRRGDELHELCDRINQAVEALRTSGRSPAPAASDPPSLDRAA
jgi:hypothetical protein